MSDFRTDTNTTYDTAPKPMLRIAIPSFRIQRRKTKFGAQKTPGVMRQEFQDLFNDDLRRPVDSISLTAEERSDYDLALELRKALYGTPK